MDLGWARGGLGAGRFGAAAGFCFGRGGCGFFDSYGKWWILAGRVAVSVLLMVPVSVEEDFLAAAERGGFWLGGRQFRPSALADLALGFLAAVESGGFWLGGGRFRPC